MGGRGGSGARHSGPRNAESWSLNRVGRLASGNEPGKTVAQEYRDKVIRGNYSANDYARAAQYGQTPAQYQAEITRDIAQRGMINPARASYGTLDEGFHRYVAMRQLGMRSMPVKWDGG